MQLRSSMQTCFGVSHFLPNISKADLQEINTHFFTLFRKALLRKNLKKNENAY